MIQKHSTLIDLAKMLKDARKYSHLLVPVNTSRINKGAITNEKRGSTQNSMLVDDNLLAAMWKHLIPAPAHSVESLCVLFGELCLQVR